MTYNNSVACSILTTHGRKRLFQYYTASTQDFLLKNNNKYSKINDSMLYVILNSQSNWWFHFRYSSWIEEGMSDAGTSPAKGRGGGYVSRVNCRIVPCRQISWQHRVFTHNIACKNVIRHGFILVWWGELDNFSFFIFCMCMFVQISF